MQGSQSAAPPANATARCYVAIGVMSLAANVGRRQAARQTWLRETPPATCVAFLVRTRDAAAPSIEAEASRHGDILRLPVGAGAKAARLVSLRSWLQLAVRRYPSASWLCKADDDAYVRAGEWEAQLRMIQAGREASARAAGRPPGEEAIIFGKMLFHNWDSRWSVPTTFSFSYGASEWRRAIDHAAGDASQARNADEARRLRRCAAEGAKACEWCVSARDCVGPFPFFAGWLSAMSAPLVRALAASPLVARDAERSVEGALSRSWGPPVFEDVWLGAAIHQWLPKQARLALVRMDETHSFNGDWPERCVLWV